MANGYTLTGVVVYMVVVAVPATESEHVTTVEHVPDYAPPSAHDTQNGIHVVRQYW